MPTILQAGTFVNARLAASEALKALGVKKVFPIIVDTARLPYVCYQRTGLAPTQVKAPAAKTAAALVEVTAYAETYAQSVQLAEAVLKALDNAQGETPSGLRVYSCCLTDCAETYESGAYAQTLTFTIRA